MKKNRFLEKGSIINWDDRGEDERGFERIKLVKVNKSLEK